MATQLYELSSTDQAVPRIFTRKVYTFAFPNDEVLQDVANTQIRHAISALVKRWPFILDVVGPPRGPKSLHIPAKNLMILYDPRTAGPPTSARTHHNIFQTQKVNSTLMESYQDLCDRGMPPSHLRNEFLYPPPHIPTASDFCAVFSLFANFIDGGLMLCFNFHHTVFDGTSCVKLIKEFARIMRGDPEIPGISMLEVDINSARKEFGELYASTAGPPTFDAFPEYVVNKSQLSNRKPGCDVTKHVLSFSSTTVEQLKAVINCFYGEEKGILSKQGCLAALIWVVVMRARAHALDGTGMAKLGIAVDFRPRMNNVIPATFMGNAIVHTVASLEVDKLAVSCLSDKDSFFDDPDEARDTVDAILTAALCIRDAVDVISQDSVLNRLNLFATIRDPTELPRNYTENLDLSGYGLDFSSWKDQCADLDFGIKGAATKCPDFVRMTWLASEGALNILPRRGGSDGDADWEVLLGLREDDWVGVMADLLLGGWAVKSVV